MHFIKYILLFFAASVTAQTKFTLSGHIPQAVQKDVQIKGYSFGEETVIAQAKTDNNGRFLLEYPAAYTGAALLQVKAGKSVIVLLDHENFSISWTELNDLSTLKFSNSPGNDALTQGLNVYQIAEGRRAGLYYLVPLYAKEPAKQDIFLSELQAQDKLMDDFMNSLPPTSYSSYYLKIRRLLADIPLTTSRYSERREGNRQEFNSLNFADERLLHSGLYTELLEANTIMLESAGSKSEAYLDSATDAILASLKDNPSLKQDVAEYLFKLYEQRSLFTAAEHLSLSMLSDTDCKLEGRNEALFEQYRKMAKGHIAHDVQLLNSNKAYKTLKSIKGRYKLVVFGASWCPKCVEEIPRLNSFYQKWKTDHDLEIVFLSLDTDKAQYDTFVKKFPWISATDLKGWDSQAAKDFYVIGTPTMYLLDSSNKILLRPVSPEQVSSWLDFNDK